MSSISSGGIAVDASWWRRRLGESIGRRGPELSDPAGACRLVFSEADGLPGLVVDRYGNRLALQLHTPGAERMREETLSCLRELLATAAVIDRSEGGHRTLEGMEPVPAAPAGEEAAVEIRESGLRFAVGLASGQKTGFYADQPHNRPAVAAWAAGRRVLDAFCYTGAFSAHAARARAAALALVDSSQEALDAARGHLALNGLDGVPAEFRRGNAFEELRRLRDP